MDPTTQALKVIGWSDGARRLLKVWLWSAEPAASGQWHGASAAEANPTDERRYRRVQGGEDR